MKLSKDKALMIVDAQNDFMPGGALAVENADEIIPIINGIVESFHTRIWTKDWHPKNHCSFKSQGGIWPAHCIKHTKGAEIHPALSVDHKDIIALKGMEKEFDAFSAFEDDAENQYPLKGILKSSGIKHLFVCGLVTEFCVQSNVVDALINGFKVTIIENGIKEISKEKGEKALKKLRQIGASIITSYDLFK